VCQCYSFKAGQWIIGSVSQFYSESAGKCSNQVIWQGDGAEVLQVPQCFSVTVVQGSMGKCSNLEMWQGDGAEVLWVPKCFSGTVS
jgi:hypothetical protein